MHKYIFFIFITLLFFNANGQQLVYKSGSKIYNSENKKLSPDEVRGILKVDKNSLGLYNSGRNKKTMGNILLIGGLGFMAADLLNGAMNTTATDTHPYPSALTFIGAAAIVASIPVKIGYSKKVQQAVDDFNKLHSDKKTIGISNGKLEFVAKGNGLGLRLTLN